MDNEVEVVKRAIRESIKDMTIYGYRIGEYVSEEQVTKVAEDVIAALEEFNAGHGGD